MKFISNFIHKHPSVWRYISSLAIFTIVIPIILINGLFPKWGRYVGLFCYMIIAIFGIYEVFQNLNISKISAFYLSLLVIIIFVIPDPRELINGKDRNIDKSIILWIKGQFNINILIVFGFSFLPLLLEKQIRPNLKTAIFQQFIILFVLIVVSIAAKTIWIINSYNYKWVFYFLLITIIADTFSYLGGKYLSKYIFNGKKLLPLVSPEKTWGGFIIGYVFSGLFIGIVGYFLGVYNDLSFSTFVLIAMSFVLPIISQMGDLLFSILKRYLNIKDFSNFIKGHGGVLDRLDSISLVMFFMTIIFLFL